MFDNAFSEEVTYDEVNHSTIEEVYRLFQASSVDFFLVMISIEHEEAEGLREISVVWSGVFDVSADYTNLMVFIDVQMGYLLNPFLLSIAFAEWNDEGVFQ